MLSCRCCSFCPGSCRLGRGSGAAKLPTAPGRHGPAPLAWPGLRPPHLDLRRLCGSNSQLVSLRAFLISRCCRDEDVPGRCKSISGPVPLPELRPRGRAAGIRRGAEPSRLWRGAGQSLPGPRRLPAAPGGSVSAERPEEILGSSISLPGSLKTPGAGQPGPAGVLACFGLTPLHEVGCLVSRSTGSL